MPDIWPCENRRRRLCSRSQHASVSQASSLCRGAPQVASTITWHRHSAARQIMAIAFLFIQTDDQSTGSSGAGERRREWSASNVHPHRICDEGLGSLYQAVARFVYEVAKPATFTAWRSEFCARHHAELAPSGIAQTGVSFPTWIRRTAAAGVRRGTFSSRRRPQIQISDLTPRCIAERPRLMCVSYAMAGRWSCSSSTRAYSALDDMQCRERKYLFAHLDRRARSTRT